MTRRTDYLTAEKLSYALSLRESSGMEAAFDSAVARGVSPPLIATVLLRSIARIEHATLGIRSDRRLRELELQAGFALAKA
ncbi:hypothetical protein GM658_05275 [Pseudoduganella eburnea]|uniref:Uncharacterized protein n=1 Tax=Massilia eburnea TaxID=1776165 RepID=A0A6L6QCV9_9BURK|nr:hypothetical protein [Massilia eburnea]MTW10005.1 hypothetical protein [Massilia eburnea]